ncbi:MAG: alpha/beta hydrolase [bacterium]|nr:alpha/beta hydrolase [bacterium]
MQNSKTIALKDGRKLGYAEYGNPKGKPLFFFHGWPSSRLQANDLDHTGVKLNVRVIGIDRPGYGLSDFKPLRSLLDWPDDVIELADILNIKTFAVVGQSGGGPYAAVCAYKIPHRLTSVGIVVGLSPTNIQGVLQGMGFLPKLAWRLYHRFPPLVEISSTLLFLQTKKFLANTFAFSYQAKSDQALLRSPGARQEMLENRKEAFRQGKKGCAWDVRLYTSDWGFRLRDITAKVYLWYGASDKNVSVAMGKYYAAQIPGSTLTVYPNEGHFILKTHAEEIVKTLMT